MSNIVTSQLDPVQYYGPLEPYAYQIDNRPLQDLRQNVDAMASVVEASVDNGKILSMAIGMASRGFAGSNIFVGRKEVIAATFILKINHGFLLQDDDASLADIRQYPHVGLQQVEHIFPSFTKPSTVGDKRCFTIQARYAPADNTISFFDAVNPNSSSVTEVGVVEYQVKQAADVLATDPDNFVPADIGWVEILRVTTFESDTQLDPTNVVRINFLDDILREYEVDTHTTTLNQTVFSGISVDATKALVFINGIYQHPGHYTVDNASQITWDVPLAAGLTVDFVVLSGGVTTGPTAPGGTYDYQIDTHIATAGQQNFTGLSVDGNYCFVFVNGVFQADVTRVSSTQVNLPAPVAAGTFVDFVVTIGGIGIPAGGVAGESLHQTTTGPAWQREIPSIEANSANTVGTLITYTCSATGFDPATDLYDGRLVTVINNGGFNAANWTNAVPNASLQIGVTTYPVKRPGNLPLQLNDVYAGMILRYRNTTGSFELLEPGNRIVNTSLRFGTSTTGTPDSITFTPEYPVQELENGTIFCIKVPGVGSNTTTLPVVSLVRPSGAPLALVIMRPGGAVAKVGDVVAGTNVVVQFDATLAAFVILNPAIAGGASFEGQTFRRNTVMTGPRLANQSFLTRHAVGASPSSSGNFTYAKPTFLKAEHVSPTVKNVYAHYFTTFPSSTTGEHAFASFAAGMSTTGAVDYVEVLPSNNVTPLFNIHNFTIGSITLTGMPVGSVQGVTKNMDTATIAFSSAHSFVAGTWVRITGLVGDSGPNIEDSLIHYNGTFKILSVPAATSIVIGIDGTNIPDFVNVAVSNARVENVLFLFAERNPGTGAVTYTTSLSPLEVHDTNLDGSGPRYLALGPTDYDFYSYDPHLGETRKYTYVFPSDPGTVVQAVPVGEIYVPASATTFTSDHVLTYAYNGEFVGVSFGSNIHYTPTGGLNFVHGYNRILHGIGSNRYDVQITGSYEQNTTPTYPVMTSNTLPSGQFSGLFNISVRDREAMSVIITNAVTSINTYTRRGFAVNATLNSAAVTVEFRVTRNY